MSRKAPRNDFMLCLHCGGEIKVIAFIFDNDVMDRIISHLELRFLVAKPPRFYVFTEVALMAAEAGVEYL